jgi:hypothetical protein
MVAPKIITRRGAEGWVIWRKALRAVIGGAHATDLLPDTIMKFAVVKLSGKNVTGLMQYCPRQGIEQIF